MWSGLDTVGAFDWVTKWVSRTYFPLAVSLVRFEGPQTFRLEISLIVYRLIRQYVLLSLTSHLLNHIGRTVPIVGDGDAVRLSGGFVGDRDDQDIVGIDVERNFDWGNTAGSRGDTGEPQISKELIVLGTGVLTLVNPDEYARLVIDVGGEDLRLLGGNSSVSLDESSHDTTAGLDPEGVRSNIEQEQVLYFLGCVTGENAGLDGSTVSDGLIRADTPVGLLSVEKVGDELDDIRDTGGITNQDNLMDVGLIDPGVTKDLLYGAEGALEEVLA